MLKPSLSTCSIGLQLDSRTLYKKAPGDPKTRNKEDVDDAMPE